MPAHFYRLALGLVLLLAACGSDVAPGPRITAEDAWARPASALAGMTASTGAEESDTGHARSGTGAVFMRLVNAGGESDRLLSAETEVAEVVEIHATRIEGDVMQMQLLPQGLEIPARSEVELKPGGYHIMLIGLKRDLVEDDVIPVVLHLEKTGTMTLEARVRTP
jgi:periplasmic copper chaperone A